MPKFHDEFFRSTTSQHDQLVVDTIRCMDQISEKYTRKYTDAGTCVSVFRCVDRKYCREENGLLEKETRCIECSYVRTGANGYSIAPPSYQPETEPVNAVRTIKIIDTATTIETEKIYSNTRNGFIIGYADIVAQVQVDLLIKLDAGQQSWCVDEEKVFYIIIDAKPRLRSWGGPLRQVKTYMKLQRTEHKAPVYGLITTYSNVNETHRQVIEEEQVTILTLSKNNRSREEPNTGQPS